MRRKLQKTDAEWRERLAPDQYAILRQGATERPWTSEYLEVKDDGIFVCAGCGAELFSSETKFESGSGWPSFTDPVNRENVELRDDRSHGMTRTEVLCANCGGHLGHVFPDGPGPTGERWCINGCALSFERKD